MLCGNRNISKIHMELLLSLLNQSAPENIVDHNSLVWIFLALAVLWETYSEPWQTSSMELSAKLVNWFQ